MEKDNVITFLGNFDVICLCEVKTPLEVYLQGFVTFRSTTTAADAHRGGVAVLVRRQLLQYVVHVDRQSDQLWMQFSFMPGVVFAFCYVPPSDSLYFNPASFGLIQERLKTDEIGKKFLLVGDFNARFGRAVRQFIPECDLSSRFSYPVIPDSVENRECQRPYTR